MIFDAQEAFEATVRAEDAANRRSLPEHVLAAIAEQQEKIYRNAMAGAELALGNGNREEVEGLAAERFLSVVCPGMDREFLTVRSNFEDLREMEFRGPIVAAAGGKVFQRVDDESFVAHKATEKLNGASVGKIMDVNYGKASEKGLQRTTRTVRSWDGYYIEYSNSQQAKAQRAEMNRSAGMSM